MIEFRILTVEPWVGRLAWSLLHFLWEGALLVLAFAAIRAILGRSLTARGRYGLACTALALMALAPVLTFLALGIEPSVPAPGIEFASVSANWIVGHQNFPQADWLAGMLPWVVAAWLSGASAFSLRLAGGWLAARRLRSVGTVRTAPPDWQRTLDALALRIGIDRPVRLLLSTIAQTPVAAGHLRPVVLLPIGALTGLPAAQLEALLAHELAHIWRSDYLANLMQSVVEALLFYHPAVWWLSGQIRAEREFCCDDLAAGIAGDRMSYARALADLELRRPVHAGLAVQATGGPLLTRIRRLVEPDRQQPARPGLAAALAVCVLLFVGASAAKVAPAPAGRVRVGLAYEAEDFPLHGRGRQVAAIRIRGFSDAAAGRLLDQLPIREGDRLEPDSLERIRGIASPYGRRVEVRIDYVGDTAAIVDIHPAGLAGSPPYRRK
jgi:beta-lactamase regulating signal transducer with metallopeptidase domain